MLQRQGGKMKFTKAAAAIAASAALLVPASAAHAATTCTWAGSQANPTGTLSISPGVTTVPSTGPLAFRASGVLAGGARCHGTMTWIGEMATGSTCAAAKFDGRVYGLP